MGLENSGRRASTIERRIRLDPNDVPCRPCDISGHAASYWANSIVPCEHLTQDDTDLAVECCRLYDLYRRAVKACETIPLDDEAANTAQKYFNQWQVLVKKLALDPVSRAKMAKQFCRTEPEDQTPEKTYFGTVG